MSEKIDEKLIEQLKNGEIFEEEPKETDPDRKSTLLNSSHNNQSRMPSSA